MSEGNNQNPQSGEAGASTSPQHLNVNGGGQGGTINSKPSRATMNSTTESASAISAQLAEGDLLKFGPENCPGTEPRGTPQIDIKCGPLLRYLGMRDKSSHIWRGTIMVVTKDDTSDYSSGPTASFLVNDMAQEAAGGGTSYEATAETVFQEYGVTFWRFAISFEMKDEVEQAVTYMINNDTERQFTFYIPAYTQTMNVMFHSCNGFSLGVDPTEFTNTLWKDVLQQHEQNHYHVMLGGGDQIYSDSLMASCPSIHAWAKEKHRLKKHNMPFSDEVKKEVETYYLWHYMGWFGHGHWTGTKGETFQPELPKAMAQIPMVNIFDDHDIIDGFGSYHDHTMRAPIFKNIGVTAFKYYMLFQHQCSQDEDFDAEPSFINGKQSGPYIPYKPHSVYARLGSHIGFYGLDCRTERRHEQVVRQESYDQMFSRIRKEVQESNGEIEHILLMLGVPFAYPRLVWLETVLSSKVMTPFKKLAKHGIMGGLTNEFDGSIELLDDLDDHWCAKHHKRERNKLVKSLLELGKELGVRITVLSGDVHLCGIGRFYSTKSGITPENDPNLMLNVISSAIVNTPPPTKVADFLNKRNKIHKYSREVHEDMVPLFAKDVDGTDRNNKRLLPRRNWCSIMRQNDQAKSGNKAPGPQWPEVFNENAQADDGKNYPDAPDSLSVVIHVEKDQMDTNGGSQPYEVLVPTLKKLN